jgi:hypothetical protein
MSGLARSSICFIRDVFKNIDKKFIGAEIGVGAGEHAIQILNTLDMQKLFLVDPYLDYLDLETYVNKEEQKKTKEVRFRLSRIIITFL